MSDFRLRERKRTVLACFIAALSAFLCFLSYELFRSSSESVFLTLYSAKDKVYALSIVPLVLAFFIWIYSKIIDKKGPVVASSFFFVLFVFFMIIFYYGSLKGLGFFIFSVLVFKEAYIVLLSEIYWSYINSVLTLTEAKRLNGYIAGFGAGGSVVGGYLVSKLSLSISTENFFIISAVSLLFSFVFLAISYRIEKPSFIVSSKKSDLSGLRYIKENQILKILFLTVFISQIFSTLSDLNFTENLKREVLEKDQRTAYLGKFWTTVNIFSFSFQFILTPIILKRFSVSLVLIVISLVHVFSSVYSFLYPSLFSASVVFLLFKSLDYSLYRASKETLYIPFNSDVRFKTKQIIDAFNYRFAKGFISVILSVLNALKINYFSFIMLFASLFAVSWFYLLRNLRSLVIKSE